MKSDDSRRAIGKVVSVAADRFVIELHRGTENFTVIGFDDVHYIASLGSFVILPIPSGYVVAEIVGLRDKDATQTRERATARGRLEKASSAKFLDTVPVGTLPRTPTAEFSFGVSVFPSLYTDALYILESEIDRIFDVANAVESSPSKAFDHATRYKALTVGESVVFQGYDVKISVDAFFGGHAAILGNTGSGKSCTVATILQSLFEKHDEHWARGATFVLLDVNGEYQQAFSNLPQKVQQTHRYLSGPIDTPRIGQGDHTRQFKLPHWFMSVEEWELLLRASERTQQPVLRTALGLTSLFADSSDPDLEALRDHILAACIRCILDSDGGGNAKKDRIIVQLNRFQSKKLNIASTKSFMENDFGGMKDVPGLTALLDSCTQENVTLPDYTNREFRFETLEHALELALLYEESHGNRQIRDYCSQLLTRFKWIRNREEFAFLRCPPEQFEDCERSQSSFVDSLIGAGANGDDVSQLIILDMNEAGDEVVEVASAVISRLVFERLRRRDPRNAYPVHLILEEAHRYVAQRKSGFAIDASRGFERIAKEGRKYGLFLILASQRPSELSSTVLSQCSNFIVHRIQNPDDMQHIRQMTPFISESVMRRLPSLPKQHALIFGSAVNLPTTFKVREVSPRPKSDDARIRDLWFRDE